MTKRMSTKYYPILVLLLILAFKESHAQTFYKTFGVPGLPEGGGAIVGDPNGGAYVGGFRGDSALVIRLDALGNSVWTRTFLPQPGWMSEVSYLSVSSDGNIVGLGYSTANSPVISSRDIGFWFKITPAGSLLWVRQEQNGTSVFFDEMDELPNGNYQLTKIYSDATTTYSDIGITQINPATGAIVFDSPRYNVSSNPYWDDLHASVYVPGQGTFISGRLYSDGASIATSRPFVSKFDLSGNASWCKFYLVDPNTTARMYGAEIYDLGNGLFSSYTGNLSSTPAIYTFGAFGISYAGNINWAYNYDITNSSDEWAFAGCQMNDGVVFFGKCTLGANQDFHLTKVSNTGTILWSRSFGGALSEESTNHLSSSAIHHQSGIWFTGMKLQNGNYDLVVGRADSTGQIACIPSTMQAVQRQQLANYSASQSISSVAMPVSAVVGPSAVNTSPIPDCAVPSVSLGPNITTCTSTVLNATTSGATSYLWNTGAQTASITVSMPGTYIVLVGQGCCFSSDTIQVSIATLDPGLPNDTSVCQGQSLIITANAGANSYLWSTGATTSSISVTTSGIYFVTVTSASCSAVDTVVVVQSALPTPDLGPDSSFCQGTTVLLDPAVVGATYQWSTGASTSNITVGQAGTYVVVVTDTNGCSAADTVSLDPLPVPFVTIGLDQSICPEDSALFQAPTGFVSYAWNTGSTASNTIAYQTGLVIVNATDSSGCVASDTAILVHWPFPIVNLGPDITLCTGSPQILDAGNPGSNHLWSTGDTTQVVIVNTAGVYSVQVTNSFGCANSDTLFIGNASPMLVATTSMPVSCTSTAPDGSASVSVSFGTSPYQYLWSNGATGQSATGLVPGQYLVTVTDLSGCIAFDSVWVDSLPDPFVFAGDSVQVCDGSPSSNAQAMATGGQPGYSYEWWCQSAACGITGGNTQSPVVNSALSQWYYVQATDSNGCRSNIDSLWVEVLPNPWVNGPHALFEVLPSTDFVQDYDTAEFLNHSSTSTTILWDFGDGTTDTSTSPLHLYERPGEYTVILYVTDTLGCIDSMAQILHISFDGNLFVPTGFTPNGDQINDFFLIVSKHIIEYDLKIFNRWGGLIFESKDPNFHWDGFYKGKPVQEGVYVWKIDATLEGGHRVTKGGSVTLFR